MEERQCVIKCSGFGDVPGCLTASLEGSARDSSSTGPGPMRCVCGRVSGRLMVRSWTFRPTLRPRSQEMQHICRQRDERDEWDVCVRERPSSLRRAR